ATAATCGRYFLPRNHCCVRTVGHILRNASPRGRASTKTRGRTAKAIGDSGAALALGGAISPGPVCQNAGGGYEKKASLTERRSPGGRRFRSYRQSGDSRFWRRRF